MGKYRKRIMIRAFTVADLLSHLRLDPKDGDIMLTIHRKRGEGNRLVVCAKQESRSATPPEMPP